MSEPAEPYAEVTKIGRWTWKIEVFIGSGQCWGPDLTGGWTVIGSRKRADKNAAKRLLQYHEWCAKLKRQSETKHQVTL